MIHQLESVTCCNW